MKKIFVTLLVITIIVVVGAAIYFIFIKDNNSSTEKSDEAEKHVDWREFEFTDSISDNSFKISDFKGQNVLVESFAVWCPTCLSQQKEMKKLQEIDDTIMHISLDTDPNEDESIVKDHAQNNDLDWLFAVSPNDVTKSLINDFGINVVFAPGAPVLLVCDDEKQSARFLPAGVKAADELKSEVEKGC